MHRSHEYLDVGNATRKLAVNRHALCFQEVHGHRAAVVASFSRWLLGWSIVPSVCADAQNFPDPASGGIVIAVCPKLVSFVRLSL